MRIVLTGAAGAIGQAVLPGLRERHDVHAVDLRDGAGVDERADVTDADVCRRLFGGARAVVHLAGDPYPGAAWASLLPTNVVAVHSVAQAAVERGVHRLVLASSLQAVAGHPDGRQVRAEDAPRPANLYGATKAWAEAVGSWVAAASATTVVALRIGHFAPAAPDTSTGDAAAWLSPGDATRLVLAAVGGPVESFAVVDGVSANRWSRAELGTAERAIGYAPVDDAWAGGSA